MPRTRWHTQIWPTPRVARGKARNDKANREQLALKSGGVQFTTERLAIGTNE